MTSTILMTGATRGIGRAAVERIAADHPGAHLMLLARPGSADDVAESLRGDGHTVTTVDADLLSTSSTRQAAEAVAARLDSGDLPPLRAIVANAGLQFTDALTATPEGFEATFAVNVLANHVLIGTLAPHLAAPAKVVITVSDTHFGDFRHNLGMVPGPQWRDPAVLARPGAFDRPASVKAGRTAYSTSKLAAIHLIHEYARRFPSGVDVVGYNPGFVPGTGLARDAGPLSRFAMRRLLPALTVTPLAASVTQAGGYLADVVSGATPTSSGDYVDKGRVVPSSAESYDPERETSLWTTVDHLIEARR
ncbi:MAG: SDR family NAD(P)-dependent oxidoreductase [Gordonia sp. (in: high G+C Gram-positive bacteria)]